MSGDQPTQVLVVCTGNSCRSIMAEALINQLSQGRMQAYSAGSQPTGRVHPEALRTLARHGITATQPRSESWDSYAQQHFDWVITVCDAAADEPCPVFAGPSKKIHWSTPDPAKASGDQAEVTATFDRVFAQLKGRIEQELL